MALGKKTGGGSRKGVPNEATSNARKAIAAFVDANADRLQGWLDRIAEDDPEKAFSLFQSVIEYHVPKLARSEISGSIDVGFSERMEKALTRANKPT